MKEKSGKAAVITGASSGIGRACALLLAQKGFQVFAGVRKPEDGDKPVTEAVRCYGDMLMVFTKRAYATEMNGSAPEVVARAVHHALTARRPRIRYTVGKGAKLLTILPRLLPNPLLDSIRSRIFGLSAFIGEQ